MEKARKIKELTKKEMKELKENFFASLLNEKNEGVSYYELAAVDDYVTDEDLCTAFADTYFVTEDFFCNL